jgi:hypothetical protein
VVHFEFSSHKLAVRKRIRLQTIWTEQNAGARCLYPNVDGLSRIVLVSTSLAKVSAVTERIQKACPTTANILVGLDPHGGPVSPRCHLDVPPTPLVIAARHAPTCVYEPGSIFLSVSSRWIELDSQL